MGATALLLCVVSVVLKTCVVWHRSSHALVFLAITQSESMDCSGHLTGAVLSAFQGRGRRRAPLYHVLVSMGQFLSAAAVKNLALLLVLCASQVHLVQVQ